MKRKIQKNETKLKEILRQKSLKIHDEKIQGYMPLTILLDL